MIGAAEKIEKDISVASPSTPTSEMLTPDEVAIRRKFCDLIRRWRHCDTPACRRVHACAGDPTPCFAQFWTSCSEPTRVWVRVGMFFVEEGRSVHSAASEADAFVRRHLKKSIRRARSQARYNA